MIIPACWLVFWAPSTTRGSVPVARASTPRFRCSHAFRQWVARRGRCVRATASTGRARAAATTRMFPQRHVPTANSRRIGAALGDAGCNSAASTARKRCLCVIRRVTPPQCAQRCCRCVLVGLQTLAATFFFTNLLPASTRATSSFRRPPASPLFPASSRAPRQALRTRCLSLSLTRALRLTVRRGR